MGDDGKMNYNGYIEEALKRWSGYIACLCSFLVSMAGGAVLVFWQIRYHPDNRELWMVPFGLVLFGTPLFVWFISIASDACCPKEQPQLPAAYEPELPSQLAPSSLSRDSFHDPER